MADAWFAGSVEVPEVVLEVVAQACSNAIEPAINKFFSIKFFSVKRRIPKAVVSGAALLREAYLASCCELGFKFIAGANQHFIIRIRR